MRQQTIAKKTLVTLNLMEENQTLAKAARRYETGKSSTLLKYQLGAFWNVWNFVLVFEEVECEDEEAKTQQLEKFWSKNYFRNEPFVVREPDTSPVLSADEDVSVTSLKACNFHSTNIC